METGLLTRTQIQRKCTPLIKKWIAENEPTLQYYFIRGLFHINNINGLYSAKKICEKATGLEFTFFSSSIAKLHEKY
jgi:hypothetical protein